MLFTLFPRVMFLALVSRSAAFRFQLPLSRYRHQKLSSLHATQKIVFLGTPEVAARSLEQLHSAALKSDGEFEVCCVVSQPAQLMGRGKKRKLTPSPVEATANSFGLPVVSPLSAKDDDFLSSLEALAPDLCITAAYGQYLPKRFLAIPRCGTLNIHPSLLPRWRGASPVQRCLEAGDPETGVSVLWTVSKMDAGNIAAQESKLLDGSEKTPELLAELFQAGTGLLLKLLPSVWTGDCTPTTSSPQTGESVAANKITVEEAQVWLEEDSASKIHNKVRGFAGWPGVWSYFAVEEEEPGRHKLISTRVASLKDLEELGLELSENSGRWVPEVFVQKGRMFTTCAPDDEEAVCSVLEVLDIQAPGKKALDSKAFANGIRGKSLVVVPRAQMEEGGGAKS